MFAAIIFAALLSLATGNEEEQQKEYQNGFGRLGHNATLVNFKIIFTVSSNKAKIRRTCKNLTATLFDRQAYDLLEHDVVQGKCVDTTDRAQLPDGFTVHKVIGTWDEANLQCMSEGAVLASPINAEVLDAMRTVIGINNTQYFIGTKYTRYPGPFMSVEGIPLDSMTIAVMEMVDKLDPRDGSCLGMDRYNIRVVPCCTRLPFMCYKAKLEANEASIAVTKQDVTSDVSGYDVSMQNTKTGTVSETHNEPKDVTKEEPIVAAETVAVVLQEPDVTTEEQVHDQTTQNTNSDVPITTDMEYTVMTEVVRNMSCDTDDEDYKFYKSTGSCYKKHKQALQWDDAQATCEAEHGHLLVVDDYEEARAIQDFNLSDMGPYAFIGLKKYEGDQGWMSVTGKLRTSLYNYWHAGEPTNDSMYCGVIYPSGALDNLYCHMVKKFICEKEFPVRPA